MSGEGMISAMRPMDPPRRVLDADQLMAAATPTPPPSPAIYASETHKDRTAREDRPA